MDHELFSPYQQSGQWWFNAPFVKCGPFESRSEAVREAATITTAGKLLADDAKAAAGGTALEDVVLLPLEPVFFAGMSKKQIERRFPVTSVGDRSRGVSLKFIRSHYAENTNHPSAIQKAS